MNGNTSTMNMTVQAERRNGRMFVAVPKNKGGVSTLNTVSDKNGAGGPLLKPYPDWKWHSRKDCIGIYSAYRVQIDQCNRLWLLDSGIESFSVRKCPAQLLMFDLSSDKLQLRISIPNEFFEDRNGEGRLTKLIVQSDGYSCQNTIVIMTYDDGSGLVVWNGKNLWRLNGVDSKILAGRIVINNLGLLISPGTFGMSFSPKTDEKSQILVLRSLASENLFAVKLDDILATSSNVPNVQLNDFSDIFHIFDAIRAKPVTLNDDKVVNYTSYYNVLPSSASALVFNPDGILFIGLNEFTAIGCWNSKTKLTADNIDILDQDNKAIEFVQDAKVLQTSRTGNDEEELWILTTNLAKYSHRRIRWLDINYRIMKKTTSSLLTNSKCIV
ncbi:major royal jelly protein 1-like isoform X2 [Belonocnema kinseyi]|uniref:major royal jelly protein 1-like isoform X2 n=1 Tax=Belonocnema kinseyi TaxID=2817044 RepID=UPI00143D14CA|nr:major royal jelly protein 1-like isoform X2 [Belonocnema kinseyi]